MASIPDHKSQFGYNHVSVKVNMESNNNNNSDLWDRLMKEAPFVPVHYESTKEEEEDLKSKVISSIDHQLLGKGQAFYKRNMGSALLVNLTALFLIYSPRSFATILIRIGYTNQSSLGKTRFTRTARHVLKWFIMDFHADPIDAMRRILKVRHIHGKTIKSLPPFTPSMFVPPHQTEKIGPDDARVLEAVHKDLAYLPEIPPTDKNHPLFTYDPPVPFSQLEMAVTQISILYLIKKFSKQFGIVDQTDEEGYIYLWDIIGKVLGMEDQFNIALNCELANEKFYDTAGTLIFLQSIKNCDLHTIRMHRNLLDDVSNYVRIPGLTHFGALYFILTIIAPPGFKGQYLRELMGWADLFAVQVMRVILFFMQHSWVARQIVNYIFQRFIVSPILKNE